MKKTTVKSFFSFCEKKSWLIVQNRRMALTLIELNVVILILGILFFTAFQLDRTRRNLQTTVFETNLSLYVLESLRNKGLTLHDIGSDLKSYNWTSEFKEFILPPEMKLSVKETSVKIEGTLEKRQILRFSLDCEKPFFNTFRRYSRELLLP